MESIYCLYMISEGRRKEQLLTFRVAHDLHAWLKDYAERKHSNMSAVITALLVELKERDETSRIELRITESKTRSGGVRRHGTQRKMGRR